MQIPKIIHYCFGMAEDFGGKPWSLLHYVCLMSAVEKIKPQAVYFYYEYEPQNPWWGITEPLITKVKIEAPREIFGRPLLNPAHQADVVRLVALQEHGGIYLDADVLVHRNFDFLLEHSTVMGQEGPDMQFGLANAVILSKPKSPFIGRWLEQYKWFRGGRSYKEPFWSEHSVQVPSFMSRFFPEEVTILNHFAFYWPLWFDHHIDWVFGSSETIDISRSLATHLWESLTWPLVKDLTPGKVRAMDTNFARWAKPYLAHLPDDFGLDRFEVEPRLLPRIGTQARRAAFERTYANSLWGSDGQSRFFSGTGSRGVAAQIYVKVIAAELDALRARLQRPLTIVDIGCGDFAIGEEIVRQTQDIYIGCDIVPELVAHNTSRYASDRISFQVLDAVTDPLPRGDVYFIRQVLQHLPNADIQSIIRKLASCPFVYVTEGQPREAAGPVNPDKPADHEIRFDWRTGIGRGVDLDQPPYNLSLRLVCQADTTNEIIKTYHIITDDR